MIARDCSASGRRRCRSCSVLVPSVINAPKSDKDAKNATNMIMSIKVERQLRQRMALTVTGVVFISSFNCRYMLNEEAIVI
jgi:hypothetical protein